MHLSVNIYQFFVLPIFLLPLSMGWALTLVPIATLSNSFWSLIHEGIHDLFHPSSRVNSSAGRLLSVFFGAPFRVLRLSHLLHHKLNRTPMEATELYDPANCSRARAAIGYYSQILGGLYLFELASSLPLLLPRTLLRRVERSFSKAETLSGTLAGSLLKDEAIREIRLDGCAILPLFGVSAACYENHWPWLVATLLVRGLFISFLDNIYHYRTPLNEVFYAENLRLPKVLSWSLPHFNLHGIHHRNPAVPWIRLPEAFAEQKGQFHGSFFEAAVRQLSGPVGIFELSDPLPIARWIAGRS